MRTGQGAPVPQKFDIYAVFYGIVLTFSQNFAI